MPLASRLRRGVDSTWRLVIKELGAFGVVGAFCFVLDLAIFQLLYAHMDVGAVTAKLISTLVSMTVAYVGHRYWSFSHRARTGLGREYVLFAVINGVTLLLGLAVVWFVRYPLDQESAVVLQIANVGSTVLGTLIRYLSYRRWVFPAHEQPAAEDAVAGDPAPPLVGDAAPVGPRPADLD
ncbi:GtrA family protein [Modestobacter versicolor]|uniref:GtrA family protein n=1 Tax=Modestobacter versicolor TaxID=429133 RepID=UPI0034DEA6D1